MSILSFLKVDKNLFEHLHYRGKKQNYHFYFFHDYDPAMNLPEFVLDPDFVPDTVFATRRRRRVFCGRAGNGKKILCKRFFLWRHKKDCINLKNFAYREIINQFSFSPLPYQIPDIYGYYEKRVCGFPVECGMFMEYLEEFEQLSVHDYKLAVPIISTLFKEGYFHGDLNSKNILIRKNPGTCEERQFALIDFDNSEKCAPFSLKNLVLMAGNYLFSTEYMAPGVLSRNDIQNFISLLYDDLMEVCQDVCSYENFQEIILRISKYVPCKPLPEDVFQGYELFTSPLPNK